MNNLKLILFFGVSVVLCTAEPPVNTYLPASRSSPSIPSAQYGTPLSRVNSISTQYGAPSALRTASSLTNYPTNRLSGVYGAPAIGGVGRQFGGSSSYRAPSPQRFPSFLPSQQYGAPLGGGYAARGGYSQGDDQSEPANYQFSYDVSAPEYGVEFGHAEGRQGDNAKGTYYVLLPDGKKQRVDYVADLDGYKPTISYEDTGRANGFGYGGGRGYSGAAGGYSGSAGGYPGAAGGYSGSAGGYPGAAGGYSGSAGGYPGAAGGYSGSAGGYPGASSGPY